MKNPQIARMLKYYRKLNHLSVEDVNAYLEKCGMQVATKTIYGWESGQTQPNADTLMYLCSLYQIKDILGTFGYTKKDSSLILSDKEKALVCAYREKKEFQSAIDKLLDLKTP